MKLFVRRSSICDRLEKALNVLLTGIGQSADQGNTSPIRALRIDPHRRIVEVVNVHRCVPGLSHCRPQPSLPP